MVFRFLMIFLLFIVLSGCYKKSSIGKTYETTVSYPVMDAGLFEAPAVVFHKGMPIYSWYDPARNLKIKSETTEHTASENYATNSINSFNLLYADKEAVYNVFRPKGHKGGGWKHIIFRASYDGGKTLTPPVILNTANGAMEPIITSNGTGSVYVAWYDERDGKYDIYMNISHDYGMTWRKNDVRINSNDISRKIPAVEPRILTKDNMVWITWIEGRNMMIRKSLDSGSTFAESIRLIENEKVYDPKLFILKGRIVLLYCSTIKKTQYTIKGLYSEDYGESWHKIDNVDIVSSTPMKVNFAIDNDNVYLALAVRDKIKKGIDNIFFLRSTDSGLSWSSPLRLQSNAPHHTFANLSKIVTDGKGTIFILWNDYRNIRANVYANYSKDYGVTWKKEELLLSPKGRNALFPHPVVTDDGNIHVIWLEYKDDRMKEAFLKAIEVDIR